MLTYAGIGTRYLNEEQEKLCISLSRYLGTNGYTLHTGAAEGADQTFAVGAFSVGARVVFHLPWKKHSAEFIDLLPPHHRALLDVRVLRTNKRDRDDDAFTSVARFHPAPDHLSWGASCLHARNYRIIAPEKFVDFVLALPSPGGGGTMQGVRIAAHYGIPVIRLDKVSEEEAQEQIRSLVENTPR